MPLFHDQTGRQITLASVPKRIVSLVPSQTELLADLGLEEEVVGITKFCVHPERWFRSKTRVGGTKQLHKDKILALQPDLIIANKEENVREQVEELMHHVPVWTSDIRNINDACEMIRSIGEITGTGEAAQHIVNTITSDISFIHHTQPGRGLRTAYLIWQNPLMTVGGDTFISDVLQQAGFVNVFSNQTRYPETSINALRTLGTQLLLLSSEPYPFREKHVVDLQTQLPQTTIRLVDGEMFSWYGSRLLKLREYLATSF